MNSFQVSGLLFHSFAYSATLSKITTFCPLTFPLNFERSVPHYRVAGTIEWQILFREWFQTLTTRFPLSWKIDRGRVCLLYWHHQQSWLHRRPTCDPNATLLRPDDAKTKKDPSETQCSLHPNLERSRERWRWAIPISTHESVRSRDFKISNSKIKPYQSSWIHFKSLDCYFTFFPIRPISPNPASFFTSLFHSILRDASCHRVARTHDRMADSLSRVIPDIGWRDLRQVGR
jgi:hypothetical protein